MEFYHVHGRSIGPNAMQPSPVAPVGFVYGIGWRIDENHADRVRSRTSNGCCFDVNSEGRYDEFMGDTAPRVGIITAVAGERVDFYL